MAQIVLDPSKVPPAENYMAEEEEEPLSAPGEPLTKRDLQVGSSIAILISVSGVKEKRIAMAAVATEWDNRYQGYSDHQHGCDGWIHCIGTRLAHQTGHHSRVSNRLCINAGTWKSFHSAVLGWSFCRAIHYCV